VDGSQSIFAGRRGERQLAPVPNPSEGQAYYRVEEEFVNAIRGTEQVTQLTFEAGVHYMEFTEAVYRSSQSGEAVHLPL
jgi:predicted dehydrogenase